MGLVDNKDVEGESRGCAAGLHGEGVAELALGALTGEPGHRNDDPREEVERVGVKTVAAPDLPHGLGVDDGEFEAELLRHLVLPLQTKAGRTDDDRGTGPVSKEQFLDHQAGFDGLTEADVVRKQKVSSWAAERSSQRLELVRLNVGAASEGCLDDMGVSGGDRPPPQGVDEGRQALGLVEPLGVDVLRELLLRPEAATRLKLPHHAELVTEPVILDRLKAYRVLQPLARVVLRTPWEALLLDICDRPVGPSHGHNLSHLGDCLEHLLRRLVLLDRVDTNHRVHPTADHRRSDLSRAADRVGSRRSDRPGLFRASDVFLMRPTEVVDSEARRLCRGRPLHGADVALPFFVVATLPCEQR